MSDAKMVDGDRLRRVCDLLALVPVVPGFPQSTFIGLDPAENGVRLSLSSYVSVSVILECSLKIKRGLSLDRRVLFPFVLGGGEYRLESKGDRLHLLHGGRRANLLTVPVDWTYGRWTVSESGRVRLPDGYEDLLRAGALCAARDPMLPQLNVVYGEVGKKTLVLASNDLMMGYVRRKNPEGPKDRKRLVFPVALVDSLVREKADAVTAGKGVMGFETDGARIWAQIPEPARKGFPRKRMKEVLKSARKAETVFTVGAKQLYETCKRISRYLSNVPSTEWEMQVSTGEFGVRVRGKTSYGDFDEDLEATAGEKREVTVNLAALLPVAEFLGSREESVRLAATETFCAVFAGDYQFVLSNRAK